MPASSGAAAAFSQLSLASTAGGASDADDTEWTADDREVDENSAEDSPGDLHRSDQAMQTDEDALEGYHPDAVLGAGQVAVSTYVRRLPEFAQ